MTDYVLVTGASKGIGRAIALEFNRRGYTVFAGVRKQDDADALKAQSSEPLYPVFVDVTNQDQIIQMADTIQQQVGDAGLAGVVNNAGLSMAGVLEYIPLDDVRYQLEVNLVGQLSVTQAVLPMIRQASGRIINIGSSGGSRLVMPGMAAYSISKAGLEMLTDGLRIELRSSGIDVISVLPGAVQTPIWDKEQAQVEQIKQSMPDEAQVRYRKVFKRLAGFYRQSEEVGIQPQQVADIVYQALTDSKPKTRYYVGADTWRFRLLSWLPDRWIDRLIMG